MLPRYLWVAAKKFVQQDFLDKTTQPWHYNKPYNPTRAPHTKTRSGSLVISPTLGAADHRGAIAPSSNPS